MNDTNNYATKDHLDKSFVGFRLEIRKDTEEIIGRVVGELLSDSMHLISERFDRIEARLDWHDRRFDDLDRRLDRLEHKVDAIGSQVDNHAMCIGRLEHGRA